MTLLLLEEVRKTSENSLGKLAVLNRQEKVICYVSHHSEGTRALLFQKQWLHSWPGSAYCYEGGAVLPGTPLPRDSFT